MHPLVRKRKVEAGEERSASAELCAELHEQFEALLDAVWRCEREWTLDDRIALGARRS